jgi:hypothetical protein
MIMLRFTCRTPWPWPTPLQSLPASWRPARCALPHGQTVQHVLLTVAEPPMATTCPLRALRARLLAAHAWRRHTVQSMERSSRRAAAPKAQVLGQKASTGARRPQDGTVAIHLRSIVGNTWDLCGWGPMSGPDSMAWLLWECPEGFQGCAPNPYLLQGSALTLPCRLLQVGRPSSQRPPPKCEAGRKHST